MRKARSSEILGLAKHSGHTDNQLGSGTERRRRTQSSPSRRSHNARWIPSDEVRYAVHTRCTWTTR